MYFKTSFKLQECLGLDERKWESKLSIFSLFSNIGKQKEALRKELL